jgi:GntR family transcriptional regulator, arabinose operon transcriptional repressor
MKEQIMTDVHLESSEPLHAKVRHKLQHAIARMKVGDKLPPERRLSEEFQVDRVTVRRAMMDLAREGFVIRNQGRGTFVKKTLNTEVPETGKTRLIGLVLPDVEMVHNAQTLKGVEDEANRQGYEVLICNSVLDTDRERGILERLSQRELAGILINPFFGDSLDPAYARLIRSIREKGKRLVLIDQYLPDTDIPAVATDKVRIGYLAAEHLIMLGHQRICYLSTGRFDMSGRGNLAGYRRALEDYGLTYDESLVIEIPIQNSAGPAYEAVMELFNKNPRACSAIATSQFSMMHGIIKALKEMGKRIPEDIALVGSEVFNNPDYSQVTHTAQPFYQMGQEAVKILFQEKEEGTFKRHVLLSPRLVIGTTCGAARTLGAEQRKKDEI